MKRNTLVVLGAMYMGLAAPSFAAAEASAQSHKHEHEAAAATATLQLNAGKKWETDAALRQAMGDIRRELSASLHGIHENRLSNKEYSILAQKIERGVSDIVAKCKLEPKADAQLHLIVAELLASADAMKGKSKTTLGAGAVQAVRALNEYGKYFNHPGWKPLG
jgi:hypothetical protein